VIERVGSNKSSGIRGDERDIARRNLFFSANTKPTPELPPFKDSLKDALKDRMLYVLAGCALISIICGMIYEPATGW